MKRATNAKGIAQAAWCIGFLVFWVGGVSALAEPPGIRYMVGDVRSTPLWVDRDAATLPDGSINWSLFTASDKTTLESPMEIDSTTGACRSFFGEPSDGRIDGKASESLEDLLKNSLAIVSGTIDAATPGFYTGLPYTLLRVRVTNVHRASETLPHDSLEVPYPWAQFSIAQRNFCTSTGLKDHPTQGRRVILFLFDPPIDRTGTLAPIKSEQIVFETEAGKLVFHPQFAKVGWLEKARFEDLEAFVSQSVAGTAVP